ncbi:hypothetical protein [Hylemonella gracilis]|uniref:Uncharacterized protein n=1 Tax=Hylemonella gracilis ATCC 19624 TaxID=887062 RepID=F3KPJ3_9BURK|nr:hypothetical protein [Hylemonella gracilis]EGI78251.1 hypothetical protein HGR_01764 [Hylemonella gracilis ATCC 19624]
MRFPVQAVLPFLALPLLLAGCGTPQLFYDRTELRHEPLPEKQVRELPEEILRRLDGRRAVWVDVDGKETPLNSATLPLLPTAELGALWAAVLLGRTGGEYDMRIHVAGKGAAPVSVLIGGNDSLRILSSRGDAPREAALTETKIRERFGLHKTFRGEWSEAERQSLAESLALLLPDELAVLRTVRFERSQRDLGRDKAARYELDGCLARITLYPAGAGFNRFLFVGDIAAPRDAVLFPLLHEIGHAVERAPARHALCTAESLRAAAEKYRSDAWRLRDQPARYNALIRRHDELVRRYDELIAEAELLRNPGPVITAYLRALAGLPPPTDYGRESLQESFAESFALFHADPQALLRARPALYRWFATGGHVQAMNAAIPRGASEAEDEGGEDSPW